MNFKEEIKNVLNDLKILGYDRRRVEKELRYSEKTIDQSLSRGGNEKMLEALKDLLATVKAGGDIKSDLDLVQVATIQMLFNEVAKLKCKVTGQKLEEVIVEMEQNTALLVKDMLKGKGRSS
jgi:hypothetical protein